MNKLSHGRIVRTVTGQQEDWTSSCFFLFQGDLRKMWQDPFVAASAKLKFMEVWHIV